MGDVPVLVVGGGPVGLALAGDLGWRRQHCLLIEQSDGAIYQPKMDLVGVRTMEQCRRWGIVRDVEASPYPRDYPQDNIYLTSLTGYELGRERFPGMGGEKPPPASPQKRERCPQNMFDPILRKFVAAQKSVEVRYRTRLVGFSQDVDGVSAEIEAVETGARETVRARFLVGCDGAGSMVREALGIPMDGGGVLTYTTNIIFRCVDLVSLHDKGFGYRHIFIGPEGTWSTIVAINGGDQWRMSLIGSSAMKTYTREEIDAAIRRAVGKDFDFEVLTVVPWMRRELVARHYGEGRVFIAGDSAHVMSPTGGYGMNTGIGDAVDLAWKMATILDGWGGAGLLEAYELERRPTAERNVTEASGNLRRMLSPGANPAIEDDSAEGAEVRTRVGEAFSQAMKNEWFTLGIHLGYRYENSPVCWPDGSPPHAYETSRYIATTRAGARAPHVWLKDGRSSLDLFGRGFVLMRLAEVDVSTIVDAAEGVGMPLEVVSLDEADVVSTYERALVLVRPDGHVAWRGDVLPADVGLLLDCVRGVRPWAWREANG